MAEIGSPEKQVSERILSMVAWAALSAGDALALIDFCHAQIARAREEERKRARCPDCGNECTDKVDSV